MNYLYILGASFVLFGCYQKADASEDSVPYDSGNDTGTSDADTDTDTDADTDADADADSDTNTDTDEPGSCNDGIVNGDEECDDANDVDMDGCFQCRITPIQVDEGNQGGIAFGPEVALLSDGGFVVSWLLAKDKNNMEESSAYFKIYDAKGEDKVAKSMLVENGWGLGMAAGAEQFVVVWSSGLVSSNIEGRIYNNAGEPLADIFEVGLWADSDNADVAMAIGNFDVAMALDGSFVVAWSDYSSTDYSLSVYTRKYDSMGTPLDDGTRIYTPYWSWGYSPITMASDDAGNVVVAWHVSEDKSSHNSGVWNSVDGGQVGANISIDWGTKKPAVALASDGSLAVSFQDVWEEYAYGHVYNSEGQSMASRFETNLENGSSISANFLGINQEDQIYVFGGYMCQRFSYDGTLVGAPFSYMEPMPSALDHYVVDMDMSPWGDFVVTWDMGRIGDNSENAVYVQRFTKNGMRLGNMEGLSSLFFP